MVGIPLPAFGHPPPQAGEGSPPEERVNSKVSPHLAHTAAVIDSIAAFIGSEK
jgi:hypothetical protein